MLLDDEEIEGGDGQEPPQREEVGQPQPGDEEFLVGAEHAQMKGDPRETGEQPPRREDEVLDGKPAVDEEGDRDRDEEEHDEMAEAGKDDAAQRLGTAQGRAVRELEAAPDVPGRRPRSVVRRA